jgi:hypothetical protein
VKTDMLSAFLEPVSKVAAWGVKVQCEPSEGLPRAIPMIPSEEFVTSAVYSIVDELEGKENGRSFRE